MARSKPKPTREEKVLRWYEKLTLWRAVVTILVAVLIYTTIAAVAERLVEPETFTNMGDAMWWSITTVSTTGYGDIVPESVGGRIVGGITMLVGMAFVPLLTSVVVAILLQRVQQRGRNPIVAEQADAHVGADDAGPGDG